MPDHGRYRERLRNLVRSFLDAELTAEFDEAWKMTLGKYDPITRLGPDEVVEAAAAAGRTLTSRDVFRRVESALKLPALWAKEAEELGYPFERGGQTYDPVQATAVILRHQHFKTYFDSLEQLASEQDLAPEDVSRHLRNAQAGFMVVGEALKEFNPDYSQRDGVIAATLWAMKGRLSALDEAIAKSTPDGPTR